MSEGHVDNRLDSWRTGVLVLVVALAAGFFSARYLGGADEAPPQSVSRPLMGTIVTVSVPDDEDDTGAATRVQAALAEMARVDSLFSWRLPAPVGMTAAARLEERVAVLEVGHGVHLMAQGAFEPRVMPLVTLWGFDTDTPGVPAAEDLSRAVEELAGMDIPADAAGYEARSERLHFGAWAKGYAVDRAVELLRRRGQAAALVNAGGEVRGYGRDWTVGVQHPRIPGALEARLAPGDLAVATSGDYEQSFEHDGERYHHLLDPRTGYPARGCQSVTVLAPDCARADALATAVFVLGPEAGMTLIEGLPDVEGLIIDAVGQRHDSSGLATYLAD